MNLNLGEHIDALIGALVGFLGSWLGFRNKLKQQNNTDFSSVSSEYKALLESYKVEVTELRKEVKELREIVNKRDLELQQVRNQLMIFESSHADVPIPMWLKDTDGKMLFINSEYERVILNPIGKKAEDYIGNFDNDIWGEKIAKAFKSHDLKVMRNKKPESFLEEWAGPNNIIMSGEIIKYPRMINNTVVGIGGIIINIQTKNTNEKTTSKS